MGFPQSLQGISAIPKIGPSPFPSTSLYITHPIISLHRGADKYLAQPGRKQATVTEDFEFPISYL